MRRSRRRKSLLDARPTRSRSMAGSTMIYAQDASGAWLRAVKSRKAGEAGIASPPIRSRTETLPNLSVCPEQLLPKSAFRQFRHPSSGKANVCFAVSAGLRVKVAVSVELTNGA